MQNLITDDHVVMSVVQLPDGEDYRLVLVYIFFIVCIKTGFNFSDATVLYYRTYLKTIKMSGSTNYLLITGRDNLPEILLQAQQVGIMSNEHSYVIMNPDFHTVDMELFKHGGSNITGILNLKYIIFCKLRLSVDYMFK